MYALAGDASALGGSSNAVVTEADAMGEDGRTPVAPAAHRQSGLDLLADTLFRTPAESSATADGSARSGMPHGEASAAPALAPAAPATWLSTGPSARSPDQSGSAQAEIQVAEAVRAASQGDLVSAQALLDQVLARHPGFRPALTVQAELAGAWHTSLQIPEELQEESRLRVQAQVTRPAPAGWVPANLLQLAPGVRTVLAADISASRLYVLRQVQGELVLERSLYLSTGARGAHKQLPGDQRTPVGVYSLRPRLRPDQLPPVAGGGAWPLAFPNRWDQWQGHLGSGIWLHGAAPGQFDGLPHSTNGCLALSDEDLAALGEQLANTDTVLLVADQLEWITSAERARRRDAALQQVPQKRVLQAGGDDRGDGAGAGASLYAYPGERGLLLVRSGEGTPAIQEHFWPAGAQEPLREPLRSARL